MDEKLQKIRTVSENPQRVNKAVPEISLEHGEVKETAKSIVDVADTVSEEGASQFTEDESRYQGNQQIQPGNGSAQIQTAVSVLPPIEEMIKQTVAAIEIELKQTKEEMTELLKDKKASPYTINDKVKRIRFLTGLMADLRRAAKHAEEFIVSLWKQYVKKSG